MTLSSMTGFARGAGEAPNMRWSCEAKSLNGRGLDLRIRLPQNLESLEPAVRNLITQRFSRGTIHVSMSVERLGNSAEVRLNRPILDQVLRIAAELEHLPGVNAARLDGLLALKGVLDVVEPEENEAEQAAREAALLQGVADTLDRLRLARRAEGGHLLTIIEGHVRRIEALVAEARSIVKNLPETVRTRIAQQVALLVDASPNLDPMRLAQETAIIVSKADVSEELDRLGAHVAQARSLMDSQEPAGRRFEFLAQEFNREANTLCSKSISVDLTRLGLDLKAVIDQFREQIQNVE